MLLGMNFDITCKEDHKYTFFDTVTTFKELILQVYAPMHAMMCITICCNRICKGEKPVWGDDVVYKVLTEQGLGPEFNTQHSYKNLGATVPLRDRDQRFPPDCWPASLALSSLKDPISKK